MALITNIADAVVAELAAETFNLPFVAERRYLPEFELKEMKDLRVTVVPKATTVTTLGRGVTQHDVEIDVAVQQKLAKEDNTEIDTLMGLVEEIGDFFRLRRLAAFPGAIWTKTQNVPIYAQEHLAEMRVFTSLLTLTFRVVR